MYATHANVNEAQAMKILLDAGANPNVHSYMGQTALMAVSNPYSSPLEKLRLLIAARADVNAQDNDGHTALMFAMYGSLIYNDTTADFWNGPNWFLYCERPAPAQTCVTHRA